MGGCEAEAEEWFPRGKDELKVPCSGEVINALPVGNVLSGRGISGILSSNVPCGYHSGKS